MRRFLFATVVAALVAGAAGLFVWSPRGGSAADVPYRLGAVDRGAITASVRATGTLNPVTTVLVGSQLSGQVVEILADYNSEVREGQVVARLDATQIRARRDAAHADVEQARADLGMRKAGIDRIRATRVRAEATLRDLAAQRERVAAQLADARRTLDRQTELIARNIASQAGFDTARTATEVQPRRRPSSSGSRPTSRSPRRRRDRPRRRSCRSRRSCATPRSTFPAPT